MDEITITVLFPGPAREWAQTDQAPLQLPTGSTLKALRSELERRFPALRKVGRSARIAVNDAFADDSTVLRNGDEIALIAPVSGGAEDTQVLVELTRAPIDEPRVSAFVHGNPELGGIVAFAGVTRGEADQRHGALTHLHYQAHESMAVKQMNRLAARARADWSADRIAMVHRLGDVPVAEISIYIAVACGHRAEAFAACRYLIDQVKQDVPIWKKDVFADGFERWGKSESLPGELIPGSDA